MRVLAWLESVRADVRFGLRSRRYRASSPSVVWVTAADALLAAARHELRRHGAFRDSHRTGADAPARDDSKHGGVRERIRASHRASHATRAARSHAALRAATRIPFGGIQPRCDGARCNRPGGSHGLRRLLQSSLYELAPADPGTLAGSILMLLVVSLGAALLPARRAAKTSPSTALRAE